MLWAQSHYQWFTRRFRDLLERWIWALARKMRTFIVSGDRRSGNFFETEGMLVGDAAFRDEKCIEKFPVVPLLRDNGEFRQAKGVRVVPDTVIRSRPYQTVTARKWSKRV